MKELSLYSAILLLFTLSSGFAQQKKIESFHYKNLTYSNNELFVQFTIDQKTQDTTVRITEKYKLPDSLTTALLDMIDSSKVLSIASNKKVVIDGIPFSLTYKLADNPPTKIYGHPSGMTDQERNILNHFRTMISPYTNYNYTTFRESLADGEYFGMRTNSLEKKENGLWTDVTDPLFIRNGEIIDLNKYKELQLEANKYRFEILKSPASTALFGSRAVHGAIIIRSK